jgi:hypothetical protein
VRLDVQPTHTLTDLHGRLPRARTAVTASVVRDMWREGWERRLDPGPEAPFGPLPLHICWPGRLRRSVDLCEPKARVRERCLGRTYCGRSMAAVSVECVTRRVVGTRWPRRVLSPECVGDRASCLVHARLCVFDLVPYSYPCTTRKRGKRTTTHDHSYRSFFVSYRGACGRAQRAPAARAPQPLGAQHAAQLVRLQLHGRLRSNRRQRRGK